jgi:hypothetical protein
MKMPAMDKFMYQPLESNSGMIRLLQLLPKKTSGGHAIPEGRINVVSLDDRPQFTALSYVWGDSLDTVPFILDGYEFRVTRNLKSALEHLQLNDKSLVIWIDSICIDQENDLEKGHQIRMMEDIYRNATSVYVWLGPEADNSDIAMDHMHNLSKVLPTITRSLAPSEYQSHGLPNEDHPVWRALGCLYT